MANSTPSWITPGPGADLYFTAGGTSQIGAYGPDTHGFATYAFPGFSLSSTSYITAGANSNLYLTASNIGAIGQFNPVTLASQVYPIPGANLGVAKYIAPGPDDNLYVTVSGGSLIEGFNPTTHIFTTYLIPTANPGITGMTSGPGNSLWFTETSANKIGALNPATHVVTEFPIPTANSGAAYITVGADGDLYFTEPGVNALGQLNPMTRAFESFPIPTANSGAAAITAGPDGNIYFTEPGANQIGEFDPGTRRFTQFAVPTANSGVAGITTGADGNIYFTESSANRIGELLISTPTTSTATQLVVTPNPAVVGQTIDMTAIVTASATGTVTFFIDGKAQTPVNVVPVAGQAQASFSTRLPDGDHVVTARFNGNAPFSPSDSNTETLVVQPAPGDGPVVTGLVRLGYHSRPTRLVLTFDEPLHPASARDIGNYQILGPDGRRIRIASVRYNPSSLTVTIAPKRRLNLHRTYRLTVVGALPTGVANTAGLLLDGALNGYPGSDYVANVAGKDLALPGREPSR